jgi:hypothetical protein
LTPKFGSYTIAVMYNPLLLFSGIASHE